MTADVLTCSYCNAIQPTRSGLAAGQRLTCVRCGESFTVTFAEALTASPPGPTSPFTASQLIQAEHPSPPGGTSANRRRSNRRVAAAVLGVMLLMSGIGLAYALRTQDFRRQNDKSLPRKARKPFGNYAEPPPLPEGPLPPAR